MGRYERPTTECPRQSSARPDLDGTEAWAVCCSGGGIRSASYCLGAFQALQEDKFLDKAKLILGVSGGGYIAASRALVAKGLSRARARQRTRQAAQRSSTFATTRGTSRPTPRRCSPGC